MSNRHKLTKATQRLTRNLHRLVHSTTKAIANWLLRGLLLLGRQRWVQAGFVLPTTVLLLLVLTLTVGSIGYRTFTRAQQTIGQRQQQVIYNAATPAIDRAKAKLAYLFDPQKDYRLPSGVPGEGQLLAMLLNQGGVVGPLPVPGQDGGDAYTFPGETRVDINGGGDDNAWKYEIDSDGDGTNDADVIYSILFGTPDNINQLKDASPNAIEDRADTLQVRHGPLSNPPSGTEVCKLAEQAEFPANDPRKGWFRDQNDPGGGVLRKNFQVDVLVVPKNPSGTVTTLEFHQDRQINSGSRWAAWFRNDLEIFPQPGFRWNGAMHTEGNLFVLGGKAGNVNNNNEFFHSYLISAKASCFFGPGSSTVSVALNQGDNPFTGQFISGTVRDNQMLDSSVRFHYVDAGGNVISNENANLLKKFDSIEAENGAVEQFALNPELLQTQNISASRGIPGGNSEGENDPAFPDRAFAKDPDPRLVRASQPAPLLDDYFRADNRCGPKPEYKANLVIPGVIGDPDGCVDTELILNNPVEETQVGLDGYWERRARFNGLRLIVGQRLELGDPAGWGGLEQDAIVDNEPLRPWDNSNPATPATVCPANSTGRCHEARQRKSLWDNLAAVQSTLVYHSGVSADETNRDVPDACIVSTVHPGTPGTLENAATFEDLAYGFEGFLGPVDPSGYNASTNGGQPAIISDFFRGKGTNGWEFQFVNSTTPTGTAIIPANGDVTTNTELMKALRNLANFAGDPQGGAPSFTPSTFGNVVHPYPSMSMWGDFSNLRRVLDRVAAGFSYDNLSPADKTTLHTAACTMGMLAYNLDYLEKFDIDAIDASISDGTYDYLEPREILGFANPAVGQKYIGLRGAIRSLLDGTSPLSLSAPDAVTARNPIFTGTPNTGGAPIGQLTNLVDNPEVGASIYDNPEVIVRLLEQWRSLLTDAGDIDAMTRMINLAKLIITKEQVARDRYWGFRGSDLASDGGADANLLDGFGKILPYYSTAPFGHCTLWTSNPSRADGDTNGFLDNAYFALPTTPPALNDSALTIFDPGSNREAEPLGTLCSRRPRYPILYSLFPVRNFPDSYIPADALPADGFPNNIDAIYSPTSTGHLEQASNIPAEFYNGATRDLKDSSLYLGYITTSNATNYEVVNPSLIALRPKQPVFDTWIVPIDNAAVPPPTVNSNVGGSAGKPLANYIRYCATTCGVGDAGALYQQVAFKDTAFYNGREAMATRMLNVDLAMLRETAAPAGSGTDWWLPVRGVVYAFREDAVAEDEIVRPEGTGMLAGDVSAYESTDPPITGNLITTKPVDYVADPDRRPFGFRIFNGIRLDRDGDNFRGLSFISDNPVYIQGDFNLHRNAGGQVLEEFAETLESQPNYGPDYFYNTRKTLNETFARQGDLWRPSEVLADAVTILSNNFCDGSILDTFVENVNALLPEYNCAGDSGFTSYRNQNLPGGLGDTTGTKWARTNIADSSGFFPPFGGSADFLADSSPVFMNLDGNAIEIVGSTLQPYGGIFKEFGDDRNEKIVAKPTEVNSIIVSGIVPSRAGQSYGGLHNFPRFLENWGGQNLRIAGAFLQLNFSKQATGPYDQDAWEPGTLPIEGNTGERSEYYNPPRRFWGYDVGLQYAPAGPIAQRFVTALFVRSEFYSEPPANDPYIHNLCVALRDEASCP